MATRAKGSEQKRAASRARVEKHRQKIYSQPELLEEYRRKERERYQKRKEKGLLKAAADLTPRQLQKQRQKWRGNSNRYNQKKRTVQNILNETPPSDDNVDANPNLQPQPRPSKKIAQSMDINHYQPPATSTPKRKQPHKLRDKLRKAQKILSKKNKELDCLRKKLKRMEKHRSTVLLASQAKKRRENHKKQCERSKRRRMGDNVRLFLNRDDVSTVINGKAGEVRKGGQIYRKRFLSDTMENLHKRFLRENPDLNVSRSQFFKLKPFWIVRPKVSDRETCACKIHENFSSKVKKLHQLGIINTASITNLVASSVCDIENTDCMYGRCEACKDLTFPVVLDPTTKNNIVSWSEWVTRSTPVTKKLQDGTMNEIDMKTTTLDKKVANIEKLVELTKTDLPRVCTHLYNIGHQFTCIKKLKETLTEHDVVVHVDYSENYTCKWSKEIKDTHFGGSHQQVTLHTGVMYFTGGQAESFATVSGSLQHNAVATWAHLEPVLEHIRSSHPLAKNIHFLSDGPTSQYRNKLAFYLASTVPFMKGFKTVTWNFTEASHGKGAPDGVGGALKNLADRLVAYGTDIPNASALLENLTKQSSVKLFEVTEENIEKCGELLPPSLKSVPGTMKIHQVVATEPGRIRFREVSCFCSQSCDCFSPKEFVFADRDPEESAETIKVGTWVLVDYDGDLYPGTVTQIASGQYEVDTMSCAGDNRFYIPSIRFAGEKVWYYLEDIKVIIPEPLPSSSTARHFCVVPEIWAKYKKKSK